MVYLCYNTYMKKHFLQSPDWEAYEQLENHQTFNLEGKDYSAMLMLEKTPFGDYLFCPYGPTVTNLAGLKNALSNLTNFAQKHKAFFIRIEPTLPLDEQSITTKDFETLGLIKSHDLDPAHTWMLDLTIPEDELLKGMESRKVRYWRGREKRGVTIRQSHNPDEITILTTFLQALGDKDSFIPQNESHLKNQLKCNFATLYIAEIDSKPIAAALIYDYDNTRYYAHAAADAEYRKIVPGTIILIQMIIDAKNNGITTFDFWGMTPSEDKNHPWYGFTQYKKSFGGYQVDYSGTWDLPIDKAKYQAYKVARKLNRIKRKLKH